MPRKAFIHKDYSAFKFIIQFDIISGMARQKTTSGNAKSENKKNSSKKIDAKLLGGLLAIVAIFAVGAVFLATANMSPKVPEDVINIACEGIEPPFWAVDCNKAFIEAYKYTIKNYGEPEAIGKSSLRLSNQIGNYIFEFIYNGNAVCITVNAANEKDLKENPEACGSTTTG